MLTLAYCENMRDENEKISHGCIDFSNSLIMLGHFRRRSLTSEGTSWLMLIRQGHVNLTLIQRFLEVNLKVGKG